VKAPAQVQVAGDSALAPDVASSRFSSALARISFFAAASSAAGNVGAD
jgi:hypothetical protein